MTAENGDYTLSREGFPDSEICKLNTLSWSRYYRRTVLNFHILAAVIVASVSHPPSVFWVEHAPGVFFVSHFGAEIVQMVDVFFFLAQRKQINDPAALVEQLSIAVLALDPRSPGQEVGRTPQATDAAVLRLIVRFCEFLMVLSACYEPA